MFKLFMSHLIMGCISIILMAGSVFATPPEANWQLWLQGQLGQHPEVIAAQKTMDAIFAQTLGMEKPLYNPEFETEYERIDGEDNYRVGMSQTLDLWGKRGAQGQQAVFLRQVARQDYQCVIQEKTAEVLNVLIDYQGAKDLVGFAEEQEEQMDTLLRLVAQRQQAGDMGQLDVELAFLNVTQQLNATAQAKAQFRQMESRLNELLPQWSESDIVIPQSFWQVKGRNLTAQELDELPAVAGAWAEYQAINSDTKLAKLAAKAEPTVGVSGGEDGGETVVAVTLSIPLHFRNRYRAETRAAGLQAESARSRYQALKRRYHFVTQSALASLQEYRRSFQRWQTLVNGRSASTVQLLEQQWESGDMSTTEYLLALDERTEGLVAGIELRSQFQQACVEWLFVSGQLADYLAPSSSNSN